MLALPARDEVDELTLVMLRRVVSPKICRIEVVSATLLSAEMLQLIEEKKPAIICIGAMPPDALAPTGYLCKKLRERFPELKILVGRWGSRGNRTRDQEHLEAAGAGYVSTKLLETRTQLLHLIQTVPGEQAPVHAGPDAALQKVAS